MSLDVGKVALALLGLLAYKNKDKLGELITGKSSSEPAEPRSEGSITGGLSDILDRFRNAGAGDQVDSWVGKGNNQPIERDHVTKAIDPQVLKELSAQTGLSEEELLDRITKDLPEAIDKVTPAGQIPSASDPNLLDDVPRPNSKW